MMELQNRYQHYLRRILFGAILRGVIVCLFLCAGFAWGQDAQLKRANVAYENMAYPEAIKLYEKALKKKFDKNGYLRLADSYRLTNNPKKAAEIYSKVVNFNQILPINYFYFAQSMMNLGLYPEAAKWFDRYAKAVPNDPRGAMFAASCRTIGSYFADTAEIKLRPFPHNTKVDEFSPTWYKEGILFSSARGEGNVIDSKYDWNEQPFLDLYYAKMTGKGDKFGRPVLIKGKLNTRFHEATCAWDSLNKLAYFTRNNFYEGKKVMDESGVVNLKLFYAVVPASGPWSNVRSLPFNSDKYSVGHPAVMLGGNTIIFISDKPGGYGGTDIYRSDRKEDAWSEPANLGPHVNGPGNEMFPYLTDDGIIYFSSDGLGGLGGLDVFWCDLNAKDCHPQNAGAPINSAADDFGFLLAGDGSWGMFSSNRNGGIGSDDIYIFQYQKPVWNAIVLDARTHKPIADAHVSMHLPSFNRELTGNTDPNGKLTMLLQRNATYQLVVEAPQYRVHRSQISTYNTKAGDQIQDTIFLERPPLLIITKVLDLQSGFAIRNAKVRVVGTDVTASTDSTGIVSFYYDPYPEYAVKPFDCPPVHEGDYCFKFTDEGFADRDTTKLTYEWSFGDGVKLREEEPRHCYNGPGTYHVELNLLDAQGKVFMNQSTYDLEVRPPAGLRIDGPDTVVLGAKVIYSAAASTLENCKLSTFNWQLNTGNAFEGSQISYAFSKPGRYVLRLDAAGSAIESPKSCGGCVTKDIVVVAPGGQRNTRDSLITAWSGKPTNPSANIECQEQKLEDYCFRFTDDGGMASDSLPFIYIWDLGDGVRMEGFSVKHCFERPGTYPVRLEILDPYTRQQIAIRSDYELDVQDQRQVYVEAYDTLSLGHIATFDAIKSDAPGCTIKSVYWNFGDGTTASGAIATHEYMRKGTYRVQLVLSGVDADGRPCSKCTYKQIQVLPNYFGNEFRDSIRNAMTLYDPIRAMPDGTLLLEILKEGYEKRKLNFDPGVDEGIVKDSVYLEKIVSDASVAIETKDDASKLRLKGATLILKDAKTGVEIGTYIMEDGIMTLPLEPGKSYSLLASKPGYLTSVEEIGPVKKGKRPIQVTLNLQPVVVGSSWVLHNLYYDFDKTNIRHDAAMELQKLVGFLQANPNLKVELGSHTDARGSDSYNLVLAQGRANSAVEYLRSKGIESDRLVARGYGEQRLLNKCEDGVTCTEEAHQENRRTEITILGLKDPIYSQARRVEDIWGTESLSIPSSPRFEGPFTILVGTYMHQKSTNYFQALDAGNKLAEHLVDGFWEYTVGTYPNYEAAQRDLPSILAKGFEHASILATPLYTLRSSIGTSMENTKPVDSIVQAPIVSEEGAYYAVQVGVVGRTVQSSFLESFGDYKTGIYEKQIEGRHVLFIGKYGSEQEAIKQLSKIRRTGHGDAFLVRFDRGKKVALDKIGGM